MTDIVFPCPACKPTSLQSSVCWSLFLPPLLPLPPDRNGQFPSGYPKRQRCAW